VCNRCGLTRRVWSLDVHCVALPARKHTPATPAGWAPLIALCDPCWGDVIVMLAGARA
jgi:hypothetical protein